MCLPYVKKANSCSSVFGHFWTLFVRTPRYVIKTYTRDVICTYLYFRSIDNKKLLDFENRFTRLFAEKSAVPSAVSRHDTNIGISSHTRR